MDDDMNPDKIRCKRSIMMNHLKYPIISIFALILVSGFYSSGQALAQESPNPDVEIPFIDRDGDGINDLLQNGWGLRFMERYKKRQLIWEQFNDVIIKGQDGPMVDTDGDGVGDIPLREYMKMKMDTLIDTDGDGKPDTALKDYLGRRFKAFDNDGDGLPDDISQEEMRKRMHEMNEWRRGIHERVADNGSIGQNSVNDRMQPMFGS
jgi:hypothetical protein